MNAQEFLVNIERELPGYLDPDELVLNWKSALIDFRKPVVERLWKQWGQWRVCLDRILPCADGEVVHQHRHRYPMAMHILAKASSPPGSYLLQALVSPLPGLNFSSQDTVAGYNVTRHPKVPDERIVVIGSRHISHSLVAVGEPLMVLMVTGQPWNAPPSRTDTLAKPLSPEKAREIGKFFSERFGFAVENSM